VSRQLRAANDTAVNFSVDTTRYRFAGFQHLLYPTMGKNATRGGQNFAAGWWQSAGSGRYPGAEGCWPGTIPSGRVKKDTKDLPKSRKIW
jgi:hypothetical protein